MRFRSSSRPLQRRRAGLKANRYEEAARAFRRALAQNPTPQTRLYLATTYASQVVPNLDSPENLRLAAQAIEQFDIILKADPSNLDAIRQEAEVFRNTNRSSDALTLYRRAETLDPGRPEFPYIIGVLDWSQAYKNVTAALAREGLRDDGAGNDGMSPALCADLRDRNTLLVEDAIGSLTRAIELNPDYSDAMTYLSLVYRRRADLHCNDAAATAAEIALADEWNRKSMAARQKNLRTVENPGTAGTTLFEAPPPPPPRRPAQ